ncbi:MAG: hypothetical protein KDD35_09180 [Bdellovibrionales bacterium]|nr:hypothetical protein [Bdellovibrionales bacterium]
MIVHPNQSTHSNVIYKLFAQPESLRDEKWEKNVLSHLPGIYVELVDESPKTGPDGWPYLFVQAIESEGKEPMTKILYWLSEKGIGLVVNPHKYAPDFVIPYGMILNFRLTGRFADFEPGIFNGVQGLDIAEGSQVCAGPPSLDYWPGYARKIVLEFLVQQGVHSPKVLMISTDNKNYDLCFSLESLGCPPEKEHVGILEALSWFFPPHYSLAIVSEKGMPKFMELKET